MISSLRTHYPSIKEPEGAPEDHIVPVAGFSSSPGFVVFPLPKGFQDFLRGNKAEDFGPLASSSPRTGRSSNTYRDNIHPLTHYSTIPVFQLGRTPSVLYQSLIFSLTFSRILAMVSPAGPLIITSAYPSWGVGSRLIMTSLAPPCTALIGIYAAG